MKLLLSVLLVFAAAATAPAAIAQDQPSSGAAVMEGVQPGVLTSPQQMEKVWMQSQAEIRPGLLDSGPGSQTGCPVVLTSAHLNWPASYLPVSSADKVTEPNLSLGFQNSSGKAIRSVALTAELRVKKDIYRMDATPVSLRLTFAGTKDLDKELSQLATIPLPKGLHEYGVIQVRLDQVFFADGTMWIAPSNSKSCSVAGNGLLAAK